MTCAQEAHKGACTNMPNSSRLAITACCYAILNTDQVNSAVITPGGKQLSLISEAEKGNGI